MPAGDRQNIVILGSTGSVGRSALDVIEHDGGARLRAFGLSAHSRLGPLVEQALAFRPRSVACSDPEGAAFVARGLRGSGIDVASGRDGIARMVADPRPTGS